MFSSRFHWDFAANRLTQALQAKRQAGDDILDLTESNPTHAGLAYPPEIVDAFGDDGILWYEPAPAGLAAPREAVAAYYAARGIAAGPERILLTASTSEAYAYLFKLLADPGDQFLVPRPSYPLFEFLATMESVEVRPYPLRYHGQWGIDLEALESAITPRTRGIILVNPNNPTGSFVHRDELEVLARISAGHGIALISDEVFSDYDFAPDPQRVSTLAGLEDGLAFSMSGLSKVAGLPQMKLGWIVVAGRPELRRAAWERLEWIADTFLSVGTPVQHAAGLLLGAGETMQRQIRERILDNLTFARRQQRGSAAQLLHAEGGWYAILQVPRTRPEEEWCLDLLNEHNVLVQPGFFYDFDSEAFLVISLLTQPGIFREGLVRLHQRFTCA